MIHTNDCDTIQIGDGIRAVYKYRISDFGLCADAARFDAEFPDGMTVRQFIESVVKCMRSEYGDFTILYDDFHVWTIPYRFGGFRISYEFVDESRRALIDRALDESISKAWVCSALDLSQYYIILKF